MTSEPSAQAAKLAAFDRAASAARRHLERERDDPVHPGDRRSEIMDRLQAAASLDQPCSVDEALDALADLGLDHTVRSAGGRYFGFVTGGTDPAALAASVLATAWDQNAALPVMSPLAAAVDTVAAGWMLEVLGLPSSATGAFCGGASVANLTALVAARDALLGAVGWSVAEQGLVGAPELSVIVSDEIHLSALKALKVAGIGARSIRRARTDRTGCVDPDRFPAIDGPTLVVLQAGNVNTGHSDPFEAIIGNLAAGSRIRDRDPGDADPQATVPPVWVHVDGAFGLWTGASNRLRHQVAGVAEADSWATDCHKWLNVPYDSGFVAVADGRHLARSMASDAAYLEGRSGERAPMHLGLQMSQSARAVPVWAALATQGREGIGAMVERCCDLAGDFAQRLSDAGAEILAPVVLNQVLVSFGSDGDTDRVLAEVASDGRTWMGGTTWQGRRAMRISVSDVSTTSVDVERSAAVVLDCWNRTRTDGAPG